MFVRAAAALKATDEVISAQCVIKQVPNENVSKRERRPLWDASERAPCNYATRRARPWHLSCAEHKHIYTAGKRAFKK